MTFAPRDDLPSAPGLEDLGPLGTLARIDGKLLRIARPKSGSLLRRPLLVDDAAPLRDAARLVEAGLVLRIGNNWAARREGLTAWTEGAFGPPRAVHPLGSAERIAWFQDAVFLLLDDALTIACATPERLRTLLGHPAGAQQHLAPARLSYEALALPPELGAAIGSVRCPVFSPECFDYETFALSETPAGCAARGRLDDACETRFLMKPGGVVATPARHAERFPKASAFGEWQPGLRNVDGLRAMLEAYHASPALTDAVVAADELVGGFRGNRGVALLAPWAGCFPGSTHPAWEHGTRPPHWYNDAWLLGWVDTNERREPHWLDERGHVWAHSEQVPVEEGELRRVGTSVEGWFARQLHLCGHGYDWPATCTTEEALPSGLQLRDDLSDDAAKVYDDGDAVWLVDDRGIQRMSRHVSTVAEFLAAAACVSEPE